MHEIFKALGNPERFRIMEELAVPHSYQITQAQANGEMKVGDVVTIAREISVKEMCYLIGISHSQTSQHLKILRAAKLVERRQEAQTAFFRMASNVNWPIQVFK